MKFKRTAATICAVAMVTVMGTTAFAAPSKGGYFFKATWPVEAGGSADSATMPNRQRQGFGANMTDEQKAEMEAKRAEMEAKRAEMEANLTDEQKAEMEAKRAEMEAKRAEKEAEFAEREAAMAAAAEKWAAMTDEQKEIIYALKDKEIDAQIETIDKYVELGLTDEKTATDMKAKLNDSKAAMRENGAMPNMPGMKMEMKMDIKFDMKPDMDMNIGIEGNCPGMGGMGRGMFGGMNGVCPSTDLPAQSSGI